MDSILDRDTIVFDLETTGIDPLNDEILQISIIDGNGKVLMDTYVKPEFTDSWPAAEAVNGISQETVKNAPHMSDIAEKVKNIFDRAGMWIAYNGSFDLEFLKPFGIERHGQIYEDEMIRFSNYYKEADEKHPGQFRWKRLTFATEHFGIEWEHGAHNSLGDVEATLKLKSVLDDIRDEVMHFYVDEENVIGLKCDTDGDGLGIITRYSLGMDETLELCDDLEQFLDVFMDNADKETARLHTPEYDEMAVEYARHTSIKSLDEDLTEKIKSQVAEQMGPAL